MSSTLAQPSELAPADTSRSFQRQLGLFDATMLVAGSMIGSGIFIVSSEMSRDVGSAGWLLVAWGLTGLITIIGALSYTELAAMMPYAGGQYVYLREAFNPLCGFLYGWTLFLVIQTGTIAAVGVAFAKFLGVWVPALGTDHILFQRPIALPSALKDFATGPYVFSISAGQLIAAGVLLFLTALNCLGVRQGKWVQNLFTVAKTAALIALIVLGLTVAFSTVAVHQNFADPWSGVFRTTSFSDVYSRWFGGTGNQMGQPSVALIVLAAWMVVGGTMTGSLFSSDAWNNVTFTAGEVQNPRRTLPWSMALGTMLVIALYMLANVSYLTALPIQGKLGAATAFERGIAFAKDDRVGTAVLEVISPQWGARLMAAAILVSTFGCVNGLILMGARLYYAMARDGLFFQRVGMLNRHGVPAAGLIVQCFWSVVLTFSGTYSQLLAYVMFAALLFYVLTVAGLFRLRRTRPEVERPYRAFGYPILPAIYMLLCALIMIDLIFVKPVTTWPGLAIVLTGIPVYLVWHAHAQRVKAREKTIHV